MNDVVEHDRWYRVIEIEASCQFSQMMKVDGEWGMSGRGWGESGSSQRAGNAQLQRLC